MFDFFKRKKPETPPPAPAQDAPRRMKIRPESVGRNKKAKDPFKPAKPPKGVVPKGAPSLGMATDEASNYAAYFNQAEYWDEDLQWLGYPLLTALAQRSEYRTIVETYAREMTRQWIKLTTTGDEDKSERIAELDKALDKYRVRDVIRMSLETDGYYGRAHIYVDMGDDSPQEVETILIRKAVKLKNKLKGFKIVEPLWTYPAEYNAIDPLSRDFYRPTSWYVNGKRVHATRLITMVARDVPNALKPAYSFGGLSLTQMARPYVDNWLRSRQSVSDLLHSYSKDVLKTNMSGVLNDGAADSYLARAALYNNTRDNRGLIMLDKTDEDFVNVSTPLSTVDKILAQSQEQMASVAQIPLIILLGITPTGLNASAESELDVWAQRVKAEQEKEVRPRLQDIIEIIQVAEFGEIDPSIGFEFVPLREMSELDEATIRKTEADTDAVYIQSGVLDPEDARNRIANDEKSLYHGVALQTPEPPEPPGGAFGDDEDEGDDPPAQDGDWREDDHPRAENGQFGSGSSATHIEYKAKISKGNERAYGVAPFSTKERSALMTEMGIVDPDSRAELKKWFDDVQKLKAFRNGAARNTDPLTKLPIAFRLQRFKEGRKDDARKKRLNEMGDAHGWTASETQKAVDSYDPKTEATRNNINATLRALRKVPELKERAYKSTDGAGRLTSRYFESPLGEIRISDHELPTNRYDGTTISRKKRLVDIVVDYDTHPQDVLNEIKNALGTKQAQDGDWHEGDHPRAENGQFGSGSSAATKTQSLYPSAPNYRADKAKLKESGYDVHSESDAAPTEQELKDAAGQYDIDRGRVFTHQTTEGKHAIFVKPKAQPVDNGGNILAPKQMVSYVGRNGEGRSVHHDIDMVLSIDDDGRVVLGDENYNVKYDGQKFDAATLHRYDMKKGSFVGTKQAQDGEWHEGDHPRAENGQFGSGGGSREVAAAEKGRHKVEYTDRNGQAVHQTFNSLADAHSFIRGAHPSVRKTATISQNKSTFSASHFADRHLDSGVNEQSILAHFPPDTKSKITDKLQEVEKRQSTHEKHKDENGKYTPERQALHEKIIAHILSPEVIERATPPAGQKPTYFILGGRGGSGKSKFKDLLPGVNSTVYLDSDEIKGALPEYEGWNAAEVHEESGDIFDEITKRSKELGLNLVHDATMKTPKKAESLVQGFKDDGYRIEAHYMHLPRQEAAKRAVERFLNSGRLVPPAVVLGNTENEKAFDLVKELADNWSFWDNHVPRGEPPQRIAAKT